MASHVAWAASRSASTVRAKRAVVLDRLQRRLGHGVDGLGPDQVVDVERVRVGRVLRRGRRPQGALDPCAPGGQGLPPGAAEPVEELPVGELRLGDRRPSPQRQGLGRADRLQPPVDLGVDPADEEAGHAGHRGQVAVVRLEAGQVGLHHVVVAVEPEDQRHVDAAALADERADRLHALGRRRHLHEQVRLGDAVVQLAGRGDGAVAVVRQIGRHLQRHEPVDAVALVVHRPQHGQRALDVGHRQRPVEVVDRGAAGRQVRELLVVRGALLHRLLEDGGVRGDAPDPALDPAGQLAAGQPAAPEVVEPGALALAVIEVVELGHPSSWRSSSSWRARQATFSGV